MRKNNLSEMTVVEQITEIQEEICEYVCQFHDREYCKDCPVQRLNYKGDKA